MRRFDLLLPLAASLSGLDWSRDAVRSHLLQRLPARLSRLAAPLADALLDRFPGRAAPDTKLIAGVLAGLPEGDRHIANILLRAVPAIVAEEGFALNAAKTRIAGGGRRQTVTGVVVNRHVNVPRPDYDRLKATLRHLCRPDDPRRRDAAFLNRLSGRISWVEEVNPPRGQRLRARFDALGLG